MSGNRNLILADAQKAGKSYEEIAKQLLNENEVVAAKVKKNVKKGKK